MLLKSKRTTHDQGGQHRQESGRRKKEPDGLLGKNKIYEAE